MGGKSNSAPLLENNDAENADQKMPVSFSYLFISFFLFPSFDPASERTRLLAREAE
jgi:hypothetical protein